MKIIAIAALMATLSACAVMQQDKHDCEADPFACGLVGNDDNTTDSNEQQYGSPEAPSPDHSDAPGAE